MADFNQIVGTPGADSLTTTSGWDIVLASNGDDIITTVFNSTDYIIGGAGEDRLIISGNSVDFHLSSHPGINNGYLLGNGNFNNLIKDIEIFQFDDMELSFDQLLNGVEPPVPVNLDGMGTLANAENFDAASKNFIFTDSVQVSNNVIISNFEEGDQIQLIEPLSYVRSISNDGENVIIAYNNSDSQNELVSVITLAGVVTSEDLVYDEASLNTAIGFDAIA